MNMEQKWIDQFNKKCAEFLGYFKKEDQLPNVWWKFTGVSHQPVFEDHEMKFHSDWNWIHVVVEKINEVILSKEHDEKETVLVYLRHNIRDYLGASLKVPLIRAINDFLDKHLEYYGN